MRVNSIKFIIPFVVLVFLLLVAIYFDLTVALQKDLLALLFFLFITLIALITIVHFYITKRLKKLQMQVQEYIDGNLDVDFSLYGNDEISTLAQTLNAMTKQIAQNNDNLQNEVSSRTKELENSLFELKEAQQNLIESEKMASLGSLVAGIAHEINTPVGLSLTGVSHINFLTKNLHEELENKQLKQSSLQVYLNDVTELSQAMESSLKNAAELIKSLKQIAVDQHTEVKRYFNLHEYVEDILISLKNTLKKQNVTIVNSIPSSLKIESYPGFFSQILNNLIHNSLMHAFEGIQNATITINTHLSGSTLTLNYSDNGSGMDETTLKHIFEPFYTTKMGQGGTGLGMYIIYNIVTTKLGGSISCDSTLNKGTHITLSIPLEKQNG